MVDVLGASAEVGVVQVREEIGALLDRGPQRAGGRVAGEDAVLRDRHQLLVAGEHQLVEVEYLEHVAGDARRELLSRAVEAHQRAAHRVAQPFELVLGVGARLVDGRQRELIGDEVESTHGDPRSTAHAGDTTLDAERRALRRRRLRPAQEAPGELGRDGVEKGLVLVVEHARRSVLDHQHAQRAAQVHDGNAEERLEGFFAALREVVESRMFARLLQPQRELPRGDGADQPLAQRQLEPSGHPAIEPDGGEHHQILVPLAEVERAHLGLHRLVDLVDDAVDLLLEAGGARGLHHDLSQQGERRRRGTSAHEGSQDISPI